MELKLKNNHLRCPECNKFSLRYHCLKWEDTGRMLGETPERECTLKEAKCNNCNAVFDVTPPN